MSRAHRHPFRSTSGLRRSARGGLLFLAIAFLGPPAHAASIDVGRGTRLHIPLRSMKELRDQNVIKQRYDYSCGSAALATLLHFGFDDDVTERDVLAAVFDTLSDDDASLRRKEGLSLLDLQRVARSRGYRAQGFRLLPEHLPLLRGPVIVFIKPFGYEHFAVLRGTKGDRVYLADPSRGNLRQPAYRFLHDWVGEDGKGIVFVVEPMQGLPSRPSPLAVPVDGSPQPELMTVRQLLSVGSPPGRLPILEGYERPRF